ncbi:hypothetical protein [Paenibacillus wynnii]|uniref:hypothetical protein n=1 Tax=Paenibacillus wynnii TaxID=268407 RepID=UPI0009FDB352|nr:hypothetical protein [Paenibacillus wynnii]
MSYRKGFLQLLIFIMVALILVPAGGGKAVAADVRPISLSGGYAHGLSAWSDGTVTGWGYNKYGQVGDGTAIDQYVPRKIAGLTDIVQVAAGSSSSFALNSAGEVWGWGQNYSLYINNDPLLPYQKRSGPTKLEGLQNVASIITNGYTGLAIKKDGTVTMWYPSFDQTDNVLMTVRYLPLTGISGIRSAVIAGNDALFLTDSGGVKQLSIYNSVYGRVRWASDPVSVNSLAASGIKQIAASGDNAFLLRTDGQVLRWNRTLKTPSTVAGLGSAYSLQTGYNKLFLVRGNGTLWQWDYNAGALAKPYQIKDAQSITNVWGSTGSFGFAQRKDGTLLGWGAGFYSGLALGSGTVTNDASITAVPVQAPLTFTVNGQTVDFYASSGVINGKIYVPSTSVFKGLGVKVNMTLSNPDPAQLFINGKKSGQDITLKYLSNTTLFPLQELCTLLGIRLDWNPATGEVQLES